MPCSRVQLARVVVRVLVLVDVVCVMLVVLIAHVDVVHAVDTVLVAIFRSHFSVVGDVRLMPQMNRRFTDCCRFPRSISVKSIVVVMSQREGCHQEVCHCLHDEEELCDQF